jgi:hypothetical protein
MKAKTSRQYPDAFQKVSVQRLAIGLSLICEQCILAYISDLHLYATLRLAVAITPNFYITVCSISVAVNTSGLKRNRSNKSSALGMAVRYQLLAIITSQTSLSVKPRPFCDVLSVRRGVVPYNVIIQTVVRNDFDCGDWLLYVVRSMYFNLYGVMLDGKYR